MNDSIIEHEQQCKDAVIEILSEHILIPDRIVYLIEKYNELY